MSDESFAPLSGRVVYQSAITGMTLDGWKIKHTVAYIDIGRSAPNDAADPDALLQPEPMWHKPNAHVQVAVAVNVARGELRFAARRERIIAHLQAYGPATIGELVDELGIGRVTLVETLKRYAGAPFVRVGVAPGSGHAEIWGLVDAQMGISEQSNTPAPQNAVAGQIAGMAEGVDDGFAEFDDYWPGLRDLPSGEDIFAGVFPVSGEPEHGR